MIRDAALEDKFRKLVQNLSSNELTKDQMQVLRHEASFNTADTKPVNMIAAVKSVLCQTVATEETKSLIRHQESSLLMAHRPREVLSKVERDALRELKAYKDLHIVPADKGRSTVVLARKDYLQKAKVTEACITGKTGYSSIKSSAAFQKPKPTEPPAPPGKFGDWGPKNW
ncbi:hypothetical protein SprV_0100479200 [Sparganum proliferum]